MPQFTVNVLSDEDFEELIAEILSDDRCVAILTQEEGAEATRIRFPPRDDGKIWDLTLSDFEAALNTAKQRLWDLRKQA